MTLGSPIHGYQAPSHIVHALESSIPIMEPQNGTMWKRDPRMAIYRNIQKVSTVEGTTSGGQLKQFLYSMASDPSKLEQTSSAETIAKELGNCIANFLMQGDDGIDLSAMLATLGVDPLVAIEVRNWWKQNLGIDVSVLELLGGGSIEKLGELAAQRLKAQNPAKFFFLSTFGFWLDSSWLTKHIYSDITDELFLSKMADPRESLFSNTPTDILELHCERIRPLTSASAGAVSTSNNRSLAD